MSEDKKSDVYGEGAKASREASRRAMEKIGDDSFEDAVCSARARRTCGDEAACPLRLQVGSLERMLREARAQIDRLTEIAYPDGPGGDAGLSVKRAEAEMAALKGDLEKARHAVELCERFYELVVKERDYERVVSDRLRRELETAHAELRRLCPSPVDLLR